MHMHTFMPAQTGNRSFYPGTDRQRTLAQAHENTHAHRENALMHEANMCMLVGKHARVYTRVAASHACLFVCPGTQA